MGDVNFFEKGCEFIKDATVLDGSRQYADALEKYQKGIEYLVTHLKCSFSLVLPGLAINSPACTDEKNERSRKAITEKVEGYLHRAQELKTMLTSGKAPAKSGGGGGGSGSASAPKYVV
jgi:hypothetical protein